MPSMSTDSTWMTVMPMAPCYLTEECHPLLHVHSLEGQPALKYTKLARLLSSRKQKWIRPWASVTEWIWAHVPLLVCEDRFCSDLYFTEEEHLSDLQRWSTLSKVTQQVGGRAWISSTPAVSSWPDQSLHLTMSQCTQGLRGFCVLGIQGLKRTDVWSSCSGVGYRHWINTHDGLFWG